jgi:hypothetical protein
MKNDDVDLRRKWIAYWRGWYDAVGAGLSGYPSLPEELWDLRCGAKTRAGTPCKMKGLYCSGRCKLHGGLSTGPKTDAGKAQARENGKLGGRGRNAKPKLMYDQAKHQDCSEVKSSLAAELESVQKPNPLKTARLWLGSDAEHRQSSTATNGSELFHGMADHALSGASKPAAPGPLNSPSRKLGIVKAGESGSTHQGSRQASWRAYCAERGVQLPKPVEPPPPQNTNRVHVVPSPRSGTR